MNKDIFKSDRYFTLFDFKISHGQLLLRSSKSETNDKNIDIIFSGTRFIQLFPHLLGVSISIVDKDKNLIGFDSDEVRIRNSKDYLFEILTENKKYYVEAYQFIVFENDLEFYETSLGIGGHGKEKKIGGSL